MRKSYKTILWNNKDTYLLPVSKVDRFVWYAGVYKNKKINCIAVLWLEFRSKKEANTSAGFYSDLLLWHTRTLFIVKFRRTFVSKRKFDEIVLFVQRKFRSKRLELSFELSREISMKTLKGKNQIRAFEMHEIFACVTFAQYCTCTSVNFTI